MKKIYLLFAAVAALVSFNSCKEEIDVKPVATPEGYEYSFSVFNDGTKAALSNTGVAWEAGDKVGMFLEGYTGYAEINTATTPNSAILYSASIIPADTYAYAYYPYDSENSNKTIAHIFLPNVQTGGSSSAMPLAGIPFKIESEIPAKDKPNGAINFMNLGSVIDFRIFSDTYAGETIDYITFTATSKKTTGGADTDLAVSGDGYLDLTGVKGNDEATLDLTFGLGTDHDYAKVTSVAVDVADSKANATTPVYMVVAPGIYSGTITIGTDVATYTFDYSNKTLARNVVKTYNMNLDNASRVASVVETVESLPYSEPFATGIGEFETDGQQVASTDIWQFASGYGMKATAYVSSTKYNSESWLTSPWIDLTSVSAAYATFEHAHRFAGTVADQLTLWVLTDEAGAAWEQVTIPNYASGSDWTFVSSGEILLNSYVGHKVKLGFKYTSNTTNAPTWEVKNVHVAEKVYTTEFTMGADAISIEVGKTKNNSVTVNSGATITYSSDDTNIATVSADGTVTGVAEGSTTINIHVDANGLYPAKDGSFDVTVTPAVSYSSFSWDLSVDETKTASADELSWVYRGVTMVNTKGTGTAANNYYPGAATPRTSTRFYGNNVLTITPYTGSTIGYVEFTATSAGYATAFAGSSWTNATASADNTTVTVTPEDGTAAFSATIGGTCGFTEVTVYYTGELKSVTKYNITVDGSIANGSVSASAATAEEGDVITLTATPDAGYALSSYDVRDASSNEVTVTDNKFTMPASNVTVTAAFAQLYTISTTADHGTITVTPSTSVVAGTVVTISASADSGYAFSSWTVTGATPASTTESTTTFTMPAGNVSVTANYETSSAKTEKEYYKLNTTVTPIGTSNSYNAYTDSDCANNLASYGTYPASATWSTTCGSKQSNTSFWWGSNNKQKSKMILNNGSVSGASAIATALGISGTDTYYSALICSTNFANISKVVMSRTTPGGTAPSNIYLLYSTDGGTSYTLADTQSDASTVTFTIASPVASATYALVIKCTDYCQYKDPVITFYTYD